MISQPEILSFCCAIEKEKRTRSITMPCRKTKSNPLELKTNILGNGLYSTNQVFLTRHQLSLIPKLHSCKYRRNSPVSEKIELKVISGIDIDIDPPLREVDGESREARSGTSYSSGDCVMSILIFMNGARAQNDNIIRTKDWKDQ